MTRKLKTNHVIKNKLISRKEAIKICKKLGLNNYDDDRIISFILYKLTGEIVDNSNKNIVDISREVLEKVIYEQLEAQKERQDKLIIGISLKEHYEKRSFLNKFFFDEYYDIKYFPLMVIVCMFFAVIIYIIKTIIYL